MIHLMSRSVYAGPEEEAAAPPPGFDGVELLTGYSAPSPAQTAFAVSAHLPYATDWRAVWHSGFEAPAGMSDEDVRYAFYGRDRDGIVAALRDAMSCAASFGPRYAVLHAGNASLDELMSASYSASDADVIDDFAEAVNSAVSGFPGGEPPCRIMFENLWWPGLRMLGPAGYRRLERDIEFERWGLCLDTGHLMVATQKAREERQAVEMLLRVFDTYPQDMVDAVGVMHLHMSLTADIVRRPAPCAGFASLPPQEKISAAYARVSAMDAHRPFTRPEAAELVSAIGPGCVTHEMLGAYPGNLADLMCQRRLFGLG